VTKCPSDKERSFSLERLFILSEVRMSEEVIEGARTPVIKDVPDETGAQNE